MSILPPRRTRLWVWLLWLAAFYGGWTVLVLAGDRWDEVAAHWPMAVSMAVGGYVAGSTPMGGGTVGFPVLVLLFGQPASLGRDFSFAVQAIGMTSASIFVLCRRQPLAWSMLQGAVVGTVIGLPVGIYVLAPFVAEIWIKIVFAVIWASFGILHLYRIDEIASHEGMTEFDERWDFRVGLAIGLFAASTVAAITGVGIDMVLYASLVLLCRADLRIAIPTSVVIMAFTSVLGVALKSITGDLHPEVFGNWLAAAPVVALGAPLGAVAVEWIGRRPTIRVVAVLCVGQFVWTCVREWATIGPAGVVAAMGAVAICLVAFERLRVWGGVLVGEARERRARRPALADARLAPGGPAEWSPPSGR